MDALAEEAWAYLALDDGDAESKAMKLEEVERACHYPIVLKALDDPSGLTMALEEIDRKLRSVEHESMAELVREGEHLSRLSDDMAWCGDSLLEMEDGLRSFGRLVGSLSEEIRRLEKETDAAADRVEHRSAAEAHLSTFVDEVILPPEMVRHIVDGKVGELDYEMQLQVLNKKIAFLNLPDTRASRAYGEIKPQVTKLLTKAVEKVRDFLLEKVGLLRRPNTNLQIIKENVLLKHKFLFEFLQDHSVEAFSEVRQGYVGTMSKLYLSLFKKYIAGLQSLKVSVGGGELLASPIAPAATGPGLMNLFAAMGSPSSAGPMDSRNPSTAFALGSRLDAVTLVDEPSLVLAVAVANKQKILFESMHRSIGKMLLETCTAEHVFCAELFGEVPGRMFDDIFRFVVDYILVEVIKQHVDTTQDLMGLLLTMKINELQRSEMKRRHIGDLNDYFVRADIALKPKFKEVFDANVRSLSTADPKILLPDATQTGPHYLTRRFAELTSSILSISLASSEEDSTLREGLKRIRSEYQDLVNRMSALIVKSKSRCIFLINNDDLILSLLDERGIKENAEDDSSAADQIGFFEELMDAHISAYIEHELNDHFGEFIKLARSNLDNKESVSDSSRARLKSIIREYTANWKVSLEHIRQSVRREFPNFRNGEVVLKRLLAQLLSYHRKAEAEIEAVDPQLKRDLVSTSSLVFEIRKFTEDF